MKRMQVMMGIAGIALGAWAAAGEWQAKVEVLPEAKAVVRVVDLRTEEKPIQVETRETVTKDNEIFQRVRTEFTFTNPNGRQMAGEFEFPIPEEAVVCGYELEVNGEMVPGVVCEKERARAAFENEMRKGVDPGIVEQVKGNIWRTRIFPLNAKTPRKASVTYLAPVLSAAGGTVIHERDGEDVYRATVRTEGKDPIATFTKGAILWEASLRREGKTAADRERLVRQLPDTGDWQLVVFSNVPEAVRKFTKKHELLDAIDAVVYDGAADLEAAIAVCVGMPRLVFAEDAEQGEHRVVVEKLAPAEKAALKMQPAQGTALATVWTARNAKDVASCRKYGVAGPNMSLIVLETLQQWLDHKIEPPKTLACHEEWVKRRAAMDDPIAAKREQTAHEAQLLKYWEERVLWWNDPKPKIKTPKSGLFDGETRAEAAMPVGAARRQRARAANAAMVMEADGMVDSEPVAMAAVPAESGNAVRAMRAAPAPAAKQAAGAAGSGTAPSVKLTAWNPKTPYLTAIKAAKEPYAEYLGQRKLYRESPAFYLDVAGCFFAAKDAPKGLRIISNLAAFKLEDAALWRTMGWRLREAAVQLGEMQVFDVAVKTFRHVKELCGEEGQSFRDLALVLAERGKLKFARGDKAGAVADVGEALALFHEAAFKLHARRATRRSNDFQVAVIALEELNGLLAWCGAQGEALGKVKTPAVDAAYRRDLPLKLRIVMSWDADQTDIDLHVLEPNGEEAFYGHRRTQDGGFVSEDVTTGYGPEEYLKKELARGVYKVLSNYYASHQTALTGATTVQATVYTDWGTKDEKMQVLTLRLDKPKQKHAIGQIEL